MSSALRRELVVNRKLPDLAFQQLCKRLERIFGSKLVKRLVDQKWLLEARDTWNDFCSGYLTTFAQNDGSDGAAALVAVACEAELTATVERVARIIRQQEVTIGALGRSDQAMVALLRRDGWATRRGNPWEENNCLADSILQLLAWHSLLVGVGGSAHLTDPERRLACQGNRDALCSNAALRPENVAGDFDRLANLQHQRHARPTVEYFLEKFCPGASARPRTILLVVHARYDSVEMPPDEYVVQVPSGSPGVPQLVLRIYAYSGDSLLGYHFDPLFPDRGREGPLDFAAVLRAGGSASASSGSAAKRVEPSKQTNVVDFRPGASQTSASASSAAAE